MTTDLYRFKGRLNVYASVYQTNDLQGAIESQEPELYAMLNNPLNLDEQTFEQDLDVWLELDRAVGEQEIDIENWDIPFEQELVNALDPFVVIDGFVVADWQSRLHIEITDIEILQEAGEDVKMRVNGLADEMFAEHESGLGWVPAPVESVQELVLEQEPEDESDVQELVLESGAESDQEQGQETVQEPALESGDESAESIKAALIGLRQEQDKLGMTAAALFDKVKREKLYKQDGTFKDFCKATGWHFTTVYDLIRVYNHPLLRAAYVEIGQMKAIKIVKSGLDDIGELIEYAKEATAQEVVKRIKELKAVDSEPVEYGLDYLQDVKTKLEQEKGLLEIRLKDVKGQLGDVLGKIKALAPVEQDKANPVKVKTFAHLGTLLRPFTSKGTLDMLGAVHLSESVLRVTDYEMALTIEGFGLPDVCASVDLNDLTKPLAKNKLWGDWQADSDKAYISVGNKSIDLSQVQNIWSGFGREYGQENIVLSAALLKEIERVGLASTDDESRPVLQSVLLRKEAGQLRVVAADGFYLATELFPVDWQLGQDLLIRQKDLVRINKTLAKLGVESVQLSVLFEDNLHKYYKLTGKNGDLVVTFEGQLEDGEFPDYTRIVPQDYLAKATVKRVDLLKVAQEQATLAKGLDKVWDTVVSLNGQVEVRLGDSVWSLDGQVETEQEEEEEVLIWVNGEKFKTLVDSTSGQDVTIKITNKTMPIVLETASGKSLLMPFHKGD